jgi:hypothetical protein
MSNVGCRFFGRLYVILYLRNGWSVNLRAIENCIFIVRSIECNYEAHCKDCVARHLTKVMFMIFSDMKKVFLCASPGVRLVT